MEHKKGGTWSEILGGLAAVILFVVLAIIIFPSIRKSASSIFEPLTKMLGLETKNAESQDSKEEGCTIMRQYWNPETAKYNPDFLVKLIVEGKGNCDKKIAIIKIYEYNFLRSDKLINEQQEIFDGNKIIANRNAGLEGEFYFTVTMNDIESKQQSSRLKIVK